MGLKISPDIDSFIQRWRELITLKPGGVEKAKSWNFLTALKELGGDTWFQLGDKDLRSSPASHKHVEQRKNINEATEEAIATKLGDPASDYTDERSTSFDPGRYLRRRTFFSELFCERKCEPEVNGFRFKE